MEEIQIKFHAFSDFSKMCETPIVSAYLFKCLQQVAAWNRECDVYVVHDEERLLLALEWETSQVVRDKQQHIYFCLLQNRAKTKKETELVANTDLLHWQHFNDFNYCDRCSA